MKLTGRLIRAGTMMVSGEEITGIVVEVPRETLRALPRLPLYSDVTVEEVAVLIQSPLGTQQLACGNRVPVENPTTIRVQ